MATILGPHELSLDTQGAANSRFFFNDHELVPATRVGSEQLMDYCEEIQDLTQQGMHLRGAIDQVGRQRVMLGILTNDADASVKEDLDLRATQLQEQWDIFSDSFVAVWVERFPEAFIPMSHKLTYITDKRTLYHALSPNTLVSFTGPAAKATNEDWEGLLYWTGTLAKGNRRTK